jgi:hypothetical protein
MVTLVHEVSFTVCFDRETEKNQNRIESTLHERLTLHPKQYLRR